MSEWSGQAYGIAELGREVLDVALKGVAGVSGVDTLGRFHERAHVGPDAMGSEVSERQQDSPDSLILEVAGQGKAQPRIGSLCVGNPGEDVFSAQADLKTSSGDVRHASPVYLLSSEIVDIVELSAQYRAEELAAAEEGALIEASGMPDPASDPRWA